MEERLQRFLSRAGVASRRKAEELITAGRVRVNGRVVSELGSKVNAHRDRVEVDGRRVVAEQHVYILLHKPKGYVTTRSDPEGRPTVMQLVGDVGARVYPVGRLDFNTEGALLLTNDGDLAHALMHPSRGVEKTYHVKLRGRADERVVAELAEGVVLDDGARTAPAKVSDLVSSEGGNNTWLEVTLHEGKNRQIHRMMEALGYQVAKLRRVRYAGLEIDDLRPGRHRPLTAAEVTALRRAAGLAAPARPAPRSAAPQQKPAPSRAKRDLRPKPRRPRR